MRIDVTDTKTRFRGCLLGGAVGDALGAPVEFLSWGDIRRAYGEEGIRDYAPAYGRRGAITDDTQMTLFTAEGLLTGWRAAAPSFDEARLGRELGLAYLRWLQTQSSEPRKNVSAETLSPLMQVPELFSPRAPGTTCLKSLRALRDPGVRARNDSKGCGGVMRVAPVGLFMARLEGDVDDWQAATFRLGADAAAVTHGHPSGYLSAGCFALVVALLARGQVLEAAIDAALGELSRHTGHEETLQAIRDAQRRARSKPMSRTALSSLGGGWVAEEALAMGLYCALSAPDFAAGVRLAVNHDGDSDSTGSIAGNLLGLMLGEPAIPAHWLEELELQELIGRIAEELAACV